MNDVLPTIEDEDDCEEEKSLKSKPKLQEVCKILQELISVLQNLEDSQQSRQLHKFIKSSNPRNPGQRVKL